MSTPHFLQQVSRFLSDLRNRADYPLRQVIRLRRGGFRFRNESKGSLYAHLSSNEQDLAQAQAARLRTDYHLDGLYADSTAENYRENLFYLELLARAFEQAEVTLPAAVKAADVGASHWFYVQALYALLKYWGCPRGRTVQLTGYEIDAYRVYADVRSRYDHAQAHLRGLDGVQYIPHGFVSQPATFDLILELFPFVFIDDHLNWGLPRPLFNPSALLCDAWASLKPDGVLVIVNQGEAEHRAQRQLLESAGIPPLCAFQHASSLFSYDLPRFVLVSRRVA